MACPSCGCKVHYQFNTEEDFAQDAERLERCAACGAVFDIEDAADDEDDYYSEEAADIAESKDRASIGDTPAPQSTEGALKMAGAAGLVPDTDVVGGAPSDGGQPK